MLESCCLDRVLRQAENREKFEISQINETQGITNSEVNASSSCDVSYDLKIYL